MKLKELKIFKYEDLLKTLTSEEIDLFIKKNDFLEYLIPWTNEKTWIFFKKDLNWDQYLKYELIELLDSDSYYSSYSALSKHNCLTDVIFNEIKNSKKYWFEDFVFWFKFNKLNEINYEDFEFDWYENTATKERAFFDFLVQEKKSIKKDWNIHQFWWLSYRIENIWDVNQNKILDFCKKTWDDDLIYLWEFFWKFIEFYKKHKIDIWDSLKHFWEMNDLKYFKDKEYFLEDYKKLKFY